MRTLNGAMGAPAIAGNAHVLHCHRCLFTLRRSHRLVIRRAARTSAVASYKAVRITHWDTKGFEGLQVEESKLRDPGDREVLVRMRLRPVNPADISLIQGRMGRPPLPLTPGAEGLGTVERCGTHATSLREGQRVVCIPSQAWSALDGSGTWQQAMLAPEENLYPVPDDVSDQDAAQFAVNPLTAYGLLDAVGPLPEGAWLAQSAAGSVLGRQVIALAAHRGIRTVNLVRRAAQRQELLSLGRAPLPMPAAPYNEGDAVVATDGSDGDVAQKIRGVTGGQGAWAALDCVGGETTRAMSAATRPGGSVIVYGALSGPTLALNILDVFLGKKLEPFVLRQWLHKLGRRRREAVLAEVMGLLQSGVIRPFSGKTFPLEEVRQAAAESVREGRGGKVFLAG